MEITAMPDISFEAHDKPLSAVLFSQRKYRIPRYQRPYAWDIDQVSQLWEDLITDVTQLEAAGLA
jgi:uncharacterized protein with ParB-like and HNH nuclease domain